MGGGPALALVLLVGVDGRSLDTLPLLSLRGGNGIDDDRLVESLKGLKDMLGGLQSVVKSCAETNAGRLGDCGQVQEPALADPQAGDRVRVRLDVQHPKFDWGNVTHESVGRLSWFEGDRCSVDFPRHPRWIGLLTELERVQPASDLPDVGDVRGRLDPNHPQRHTADASTSCA